MLLRMGQAGGNLIDQLKSTTPKITALLTSTGALGRTWQIGTTALWIAVLLSAYVALYYL
jgi:hypothetical protein